MVAVVDEPGAPATRPRPEAGDDRHSEEEDKEERRRKATLSLQQRMAQLI